MLTSAAESFPEFFNTVLVQSDQSLEHKEYYSDLMLPNAYIKAEIISSKTLHGITEKFTVIKDPNLSFREKVYVIEVDLCFAKYTIEKRYSLFFDFYKKIDQKYKGIGLDTTDFPSRKIFGSFTHATIEHRKSHLNRFLDFLCQIFKIEGITEFLEFLEIEKRLKMLKRNGALESIPKVLSHYQDHVSRDDSQALEFLALFNKKPKVLCRSFKEFDIYFADHRPRLSKKCIQKLFHGDHDLQGLVHLCGKVDSKTESHLTCGGGLSLIVKLLDYEYNKDAEIYHQVFGSTNFRDIMCLYFEHHIQGKVIRTCKIAALKLLCIFLNHNPNLSVCQLLSSEETIQEFETWKLSQQTTSIKAENYRRHS